MKFKLNDKVINKDKTIGIVTSVTSTFKWNEILQPIEVIFEDQEKPEYYLEDGIYHPNTISVMDITPLSKLAKAMK